MNEEKKISTGRSLDVLSELYTRFLGSGLQDHEYPALADEMWGDSELSDRAFMQGVLSDPPEPRSVFASQDLLIVLAAEARLQDIQEPTSAESARMHLTQMRMAICYCLNTTVSLRNRLSSAFYVLARASSDRSLPTAKALRMWLAEVAYRLFNEFTSSENSKNLNWLAGIGRKAILDQASHCRSTSDLYGLLRPFCDLTLRIEEPSRESNKWEAWERTVQRSLGKFKIDATKTLKSGESSAEAVGDIAEGILRLVRAAMFQNSEVLSGWLKLYRKLPINATSFLAGAPDVQELFQTLLVIARAHVARKRAVDPSLHEVLGLLREIEIRGRMNQAHVQNFDLIKSMEGMRELLQLEIKGDLTDEENIRCKELKKEADKICPPQFAIDQSILQGTIDELLQPNTRRGLALSGGGFRAACFHLGVLAAMADRDQLRRVDILSCVSGGAIAGAAYAIRLKALHATKHDLEITAEDHKKVVSHLIDVFIHVTGMNLRATAFKSPRAIWHMWLKPNYTFSERIADLLDDHLFTPLVGSNPEYSNTDAANLKALRRAGLNYSLPLQTGLRNFLNERKTIWPLAAWDLTQAPLGEPLSFEANSDRNRIRRSKCPELFINTTVLNTGGGYIFSTKGSGEPINELRREISSRPIFQWRNYGSISAGGNMVPESFRISRIVAASASVPGLLSPILFKRTGQEALLALSDGGVCDNQGFNPLFSNGCNWILASDAAGQLKFQAFPGVANIDVLTHSTDVLMERVREQSYTMAHGFVATQPGIKFTALHLTRGLSDPLPKDIFEDDERLVDRMRTLQRTTEFGVDSKCQRLLASMRTDLDCHSEAEALSLMASGYLQAYHSLDEGGSPCANSAQGWRFGEVIPKLENFEQEGDLAAVLGAARYRVMRLPRLVAAKLGLVDAGQRVMLAALYLAALAVAASAVFAVPAGGAISHVLRWMVLYLFGAFLIHKLPSTSFKRWLWKLASGPFLLAAMLYSWMVIYGTDHLYRRICRLK